MAIKKVTMKQKVLDFIKAAGPKGLRFTDIQRYIVEDLHGFNYDKKKKERVYDSKNKGFVYRNRRVYRGYWCTALGGTSNRFNPCCEERLLNIYCKKVNGRWVHKAHVVNQFSNLLIIPL